MDPAESFSDVIRFAQRMLAEVNELNLCGWRARIPEILQFFRENFARISRDLDAGRALFRIWYKGIVLHLLRAARCC